jgi:hypothetical protein
MADNCYADCCYAECRYAECRVLFIIMLYTIMLNYSRNLLMSVIECLSQPGLSSLIKYIWVRPVAILEWTT